MSRTLSMRQYWTTLTILHHVNFLRQLLTSTSYVNFLQRSWSENLMAHLHDDLNAGVTVTNNVFPVDWGVHAIKVYTQRQSHTQQHIAWDQRGLSGSQRMWSVILFRRHSYLCGLLHTFKVDLTSLVTSCVKQVSCAHLFVSLDLTQQRHHDT
jgi:hypothetical protein